MSNLMIKRIAIAFSLLAFIALADTYFKKHKDFLEYSYYYWFVSDAKPQPDPDFTRYYSEDRRGYYQYNPETILSNLAGGKTDVFTPLLIESPNDVNVSYADVKWTQTDFLRVADAFSRLVWNEPLDFDSWNISLFLLSGVCGDDFSGFTNFEITYYKTIKTGIETVYSARHLEFVPRRGIVAWGGNGNFSTLFIFKWNTIELRKLKITADEAVKIAEKNGGKDARLNNDCALYVKMFENPNRINEHDWLVEYYSNSKFSVFINPFTGEVR